MLFDELTFATGEQAVQYVALCRSGAGRARDNVKIDYVGLRASPGHYDVQCDPLPPPPPPPLGEAFAPTPYFSVNSYDGRSYTGNQANSNKEWRDVAGTNGLTQRPVVVSLLRCRLRG